MKVLKLTEYIRLYVMDGFERNRRHRGLCVKYGVM